MAAIFTKNCILSNDIDCYCLVCSEPLVTEEKIFAHILHPHHKEKLNSCGYYEKYTGGFIRKINGAGAGYFCEPCAITFPKAFEVEVHLKSINHSTKQCIKRVRNEIVAFDKYLISEDAWNGIIEDSCFICDTEFEDSTSHKASRSHAMNLVKSDVVISNSIDGVYRKIDAEHFHCLTCNEIINNHPNRHFTYNDHKDLLKLYNQTSITSEKGNNNDE